MFWEEEESESLTPTKEVVDLSFSIAATQLPVEHAYLLLQAIQQVLPWFSDEEGAGMHQIHGAESGNGWQRPDDGGEMYISKRTKLILRLPQQRVADAELLSGQTLDIGGHSLEVGKANVRLLNPLSTIYARYVITGDDESEEQFLESVVGQLREMGASCKRVLSGKTRMIRLPERELKTRSVMLADISKEDSLHIQQRGLGDARQLGCGLFIPHKGINRI